MRAGSYAVVWTLVSWCRVSGSDQDYSLYSGAFRRIGGHSEAAVVVDGPANAAHSVAQRPLQSCHGGGRLAHLHPHGLDVAEDLLLVAGQGDSYSQQVSGRDGEKGKCAQIFGNNSKMISITLVGRGPGVVPPRQTSITSYQSANVT